MKGVGSSLRPQWKTLPGRCPSLASPILRFGATTSVRSGARSVAPWLCEPLDVGDRAVFHRARHIRILVELLKAVIVDLHDSLACVFPGALVDGSLTQCLPKPRGLEGVVKGSGGG